MYQFPPWVTEYSTTLFTSVGVSVNVDDGSFDDVVVGWQSSAH